MRSPYTTKSNRQRKAHQVESDGTARKSMHPARGDLFIERWAEVSRGHSSEEGRESGWSEGPKARRDFASGQSPVPFEKLPEGSRPATTTAEAAGGFRRTSRLGEAGSVRGEGCE